MMEKEQYCVATLQNTIVFEGTESECHDYIKQAIAKGQKIGYLRNTTIAELEAETLKKAEGASPFPTNEKKPCPVDRGKLLIGLECCREADPEKCQACPYYPIRNYCGETLAGDSLAYISWLEEMVEGLLSEPVQAAIKGIVSVFDKIQLDGGETIEAVCALARNGKDKEETQ